MDSDSLEFLKNNCNEDIEFLAEKTGYCTVTVRNTLKKLGIEIISKNKKVTEGIEIISKNKKVTEEIEKYIIEHPEENQNEIAEKFNLSYSTINQIRLKNGIRKHAKHLHYW